MPQITPMEVKKVIIPDNEFTYNVIGAVYDVYNELGFGYQEKYYYRAIKQKFLSKGFIVQEQLLTRLMSEGKTIGRYYLDFLIDKKLVVELKIANQVYQKHVKQVLGYLKANNLKLGIIAVYSPNGVIIKRVII